MLCCLATKESMEEVIEEVDFLANKAHVSKSVAVELIKVIILDEVLTELKSIQSSLSGGSTE